CGPGRRQRREDREAGSRTVRSGSRSTAREHPSASMAFGADGIVDRRTRPLRLSADQHRRLRRHARVRRELTAWLFLGPMFLFFVVFLVVPVIGTVWWSTQSGGIVSGTKSVGL